MTYPNIYFENKAARSIFVVLRADLGTLEIHAYGHAVPDAIELVPGKAAVVPVAGQLESCIRDGSLHFRFQSHMAATNPPTYFVPGAEYARAPDGQILGPIYLFENLRN